MEYINNYFENPSLTQIIVSMSILFAIGMSLVVWNAIENKRKVKPIEIVGVLVTLPFFQYIIVLVFMIIGTAILYWLFYGMGWVLALILNASMKVFKTE